MSRTASAGRETPRPGFVRMSATGAMRCAHVPRNWSAIDDVGVQIAGSGRRRRSMLRAALGGGDNVVKVRISLPNPESGGGYILATSTWPSAPKAGDLVTVDIPNLFGETFTELVRVDAVTLTANGYDALGQILYEAMADIRVHALGGVWEILRQGGAALHADALVNRAFLRTLRMLMARVPERSDVAEVPSLGSIGNSVRVYAEAAGRGEERLLKAIHHLISTVKGRDRADQASGRWHDIDTPRSTEAPV